jgi:hypothetical protein
MCGHFGAVVGLALPPPRGDDGVSEPAGRGGAAHRHLRRDIGQPEPPRAGGLEQRH